jgi:hypothetical protein
MNSLDIHRYTMLVRVREFGAAHRDLFPAAGTAGQLFGAISQAVDELGAHVATEAAGEDAAVQGATSKAAAREALWQALDTIARTARAFAVDTPGVDGAFRLPSVRNDHEIATAARKFGEKAAPLKARFLAYGLPRTFLADLKAARDAFERATQDRFAARQTRAGAKAGIYTAIEAALLALTRLDAIVLNTLKGKPTLLAEWTTARRRAKVRARAEREPVPAEPTPATPAVPAPSDAPDTGKAA